MKTDPRRNGFMVRSLDVKCRNQRQEVVGQREEEIDFEMAEGCGLIDGCNEIFLGKKSYSLVADNRMSNRARGACR